MHNNTKKVYLALSGGVDSAVAGYLLKKAGYDVRAVYMNCFDNEDSDCRALEDEKDAVKVASKLGIPFETFDFRKEYSERVLKNFVDSYKAGITPNPDVLCNSEIKFGVFVHKVLERHEKALIATGHYARSVKTKEYFSNRIPEYFSDHDNLLLSGEDHLKDQSYFLYRLVNNQDVLRRCLFPIGNLSKSDVRRIASSNDIPVADKPDSQGICFIGSVKIRSFLQKWVKLRKGCVINKNGEVIGAHKGYQIYTIGQRRGFDITKPTGVPMYVIDKDVEKNILIVAKKEDAYVDEFVVKFVANNSEKGTILPLLRQNRINNTPLKAVEKIGDKQISVRIRNLGEKIPCKLILLDDKSLLDSFLNSNLIKKKELKNVEYVGVKLKKKEFGVACGQSAVFYLDDIVLKGAEIELVNTSYKKRAIFGP